MKQHRWKTTHSGAPSPELLHFVLVPFSMTPPRFSKLWQNKPLHPPKGKKRHLDPKRRVIGPVETDQRGTGKLPFRAT